MNLNQLMTGVGFLPTASNFVRHRPVRIPDPYNPAHTIEGEDTDDVTFTGFLSSQTGSDNLSQPRDQTQSSATLTVDNPVIDLQRHDEIEPIPADGRKWIITGFPAKDINPFTGWQPTLECSLEEVTG